MKKYIYKIVYGNSVVVKVSKYIYNVKNNLPKTNNKM